MDPVTFFAALPADKTRADTLRAPPAGVDENEWHQILVGWQHVSVTRSSPCPVADEEIVRLSLFDPTHVQDGKLSRLAFSALLKLGMSTDRACYMSIPQAFARAQAKAARDQSGAWGYLDLSVSTLRSLMPAEKDRPIKAGLPVVGVYDTAVEAEDGVEENLAHAEAFIIAKKSNDKPLKSVMSDLMDLYEDAVKRWDQTENE